MITKKRSAEIENPENAFDSAKNYLAGLLLLGSAILGSPDMLKAAEKYRDNAGQKTEENTEQTADDIYLKFEKNLQREFERNKDLMLESMLCGQEPDMTLEGRRIYEEDIRKRFGDALKRTLKESGFCQCLKENLKEGIKSRFSKKEEYESDVFLERTLAGEKSDEDLTQENQREKSYLLGAEKMSTGVNAGISGGEINISGSLTLENFGLGMLRVDRGRFVCGNQGLKLELEKTIRNEIYQAFFRLRDFDNPRIDSGVNWSYGNPVKGIGQLGAGIECRIRNDANGNRQTEISGLLSLTKYLN